MRAVFGSGVKPVTAASIPRTLLYTGNVQAIVVQATTTLTADLVGAEGAGGLSGAKAGGKGGRLQAILSVTGPAVPVVYVGGKPTGSTGGYNGGASDPSPGGTYAGGGGGGATDVRAAGTALANRVLIAGGGGGASDFSNTALIGPGGDGGGTTGQNGQGPGANGSGGTPSAGGAAGSGSSGTGSVGTLGAGGNGSAFSTTGRSGGGASGYYGGGGGGISVGSLYGSGGGGSSYADPAATGVAHTQGYQTGHGQAALTWTQTLAPPGSVTLVGKSAAVSATPSFPASGIQAGDLAILITGIEANRAPTYAGWTVLAGQGNSGAGFCITFTMKVCDGTENGTSLAALYSSSFVGVGVIYVFRGATTVQTSLGDNYDAHGTATTATFQGVTPNAASAVILAAICNDGTTSLAGAPSGSTPALSLDFNASAGGANISIAVGRGTASGTSNTGVRTATSSNSSWTTLTVAVSP